MQGAQYGPECHYRRVSAASHSHGRRPAPELRSSCRPGGRRGSAGAVHCLRALAASLVAGTPTCRRAASRRTPCGPLLMALLRTAVATRTGTYSFPRRLTRLWQRTTVCASLVEPHVSLLRHPCLPPPARSVVLEARPEVPGTRRAQVRLPQHRRRQLPPGARRPA